MPTCSKSHAKWNGRWTCPHVVNPMQNGRWTCQNVANTIQNGSWTCPHVVNPMQNGRWTCQNVANTMQNDKFKFQTVANTIITRQMVPAKKSKKKSQTCSQKKKLKLFHTPFPPADEDELRRRIPWRRIALPKTNSFSKTNSEDEFPEDELPEDEFWRRIRSLNTNYFPKTNSEDEFTEDENCPPKTNSLPKTNGSRRRILSRRPGPTKECSIRKCKLGSPYGPSSTTFQKDRVVKRSFEQTPRVLKYNRYRYWYSQLSC